MYMVTEYILYFTLYSSFGISMWVWIIGSVGICPLVYARDWLRPNIRQVIYLFVYNIHLFKHLVYLDYMKEQKISNE